MAYAPIVKIEKFTSEKDDAQMWLNNIKKAIAANEWNDARAMQAISYFFQDTISIQLRTILTKLLTSNTATNLLTTHLSDFSTSYLLTTAASNISTPTNSNTATSFNSDNT
ncbi:hypothetical protein G9A89_021802 [Geosiphon pyriformis]|nr:hypothetical protein G9A89_021802 [Geosiphon pyriformis]